MRLATITEGGADARSRTVTFRHDVLGQVLRRDEADANTGAGDPHAISYRFDGRGIGAVGNDSTVDKTYLDSVETRGDAPGTGAFRGGAATGVAYAQFGQGFDSVSSYAQGADGGRYTVNAGDTLSGIALQLWGDVSLWYKLDGSSAGFPRSGIGRASGRSASAASDAPPGGATVGRAARERSRRHG